jgi:alkyl sulfatase BDS1-like metallo-beta-lactamase superfamily hydrolase
VTVKLDNAFRLLTAAMGDLDSPGLEISGDRAALQQLLGVLDQPDPSFNIITP